MNTASFSVHPTPIGQVLLVSTAAGLAALEVLDGPPGPVIAGVSAALGPLPLVADDAATAPAAAQLDEYLAGARRAFDLAIDWRLTQGFARRALKAVCDIPYGEVASYGEVAIAAGSPRAHRAVGTACARAPLSIVVPVHRVVRGDGTVGRYGRHPQLKQHLIDLEAGVAATA